MEAGDFRCWPIRLLRRGNALPSRQLSGPMQTPSYVPLPSRPKSVFSRPVRDSPGAEPRRVPLDEARAWDRAQACRMRCKPAIRVNYLKSKAAAEQTAIEFALLRQRELALARRTPTRHSQRRCCAIPPYRPNWRDGGLLRRVKMSRATHFVGTAGLPQ